MKFNAIKILICLLAYFLCGGSTAQLAGHCAEAGFPDLATKSTRVRIGVISKSVRGEVFLTSGSQLANHYSQLENYNRDVLKAPTVLWMGELPDETDSPRFMAFIRSIQAQARVGGAPTTAAKVEYAPRHLLKLQVASGLVNLENKLGLISRWQSNLFQQERAYADIKVSGIEDYFAGEGVLHRYLRLGRSHNYDETATTRLRHVLQEYRQTAPPYATYEALHAELAGLRFFLESQGVDILPLRAVEREIAAKVLWTFDGAYSDEKANKFAILPHIEVYRRVGSFIAMLADEGFAPPALAEARELIEGKIFQGLLLSLGDQRKLRDGLKELIQLLSDTNPAPEFIRVQPIHP